MSQRDDEPTGGDAQLTEIGRGWLRYQATADEKDWWAVQAMMEAISGAQPGQLALPWRLMLVVTSLVQPGDMRRIADIGAGPLESLLMLFGDEAMDLVEPAVGADLVLLKALATVWLWDAPIRPRIDDVLAANGQELLRGERPAN